MQKTCTRQVFCLRHGKEQSQNQNRFGGDVAGNALDREPD
jgi:hypothetical protein